MKQLVIETDKLLHNIITVKQKAQCAKIYAVLKADGYGLGAINLAKILVENGINSFAVSCIEEAVELREIYKEEEVLLLCSTTSAYDNQKIIELNLTATIGSIESAIALNNEAVNNEKIAKAHIEIDTGFGRFGFLHTDTKNILSVYNSFSNIQLEGIYTHLSSSFGKRKHTDLQKQRFIDVISFLENNKIEVGTRHIANSNAVFKYDDLNFDAVRIGSAFCGRLIAKNNLKPVGYLQTDIKEIKYLPKNSNIGYGNVVKIKSIKKIAILSIGISDGIAVERSKGLFRVIDKLRYIINDLKITNRNNLTFIVNGENVKMLGRAGLTSLVLDVTDVECSCLDIAVLNVNPIFISSKIEKILKNK